MEAMISMSVHKTQTSVRTVLAKTCWVDTGFAFLLIYPIFHFHDQNMKTSGVCYP